MAEGSRDLIMCTWTLSKDEEFKLGKLDDEVSVQLCQLLAFLLCIRVAGRRGRTEACSSCTVHSVKWQTLALPLFLNFWRFVVMLTLAVHCFLAECRCSLSALAIFQSYKYCL